VYQEVSEVERRLTELQSQIDRLSMSLHLWREGQDQLKPMEQRLSQLTAQCADIVERWSVTGERHAQVVSEIEQRLGDWNAAESRVAQDASARIQDLQRVIEHEWSALREIHEEPARQLREQADSLTEVCVAAATSALTGFERTEARLAGLETDLHRQLGELSDQMRAAVAELRSSSGGQPPALPAQQPSWPLDGVVRLHNQLRRSSDANHAPERSLSAEPRLALPAAASELSERMQTLERDLTDGQTAIRQAAQRSNRASRLWQGAIVLLVLAIGGAAGVLVYRLQRQVGAAEARVTAAENRAQAAAQAADQQIAATRDDAARQIAEARETALRAQTISDVLAAPDLVRYNLAGGDGTTLFRAQVLWSRSRGLVFSGSRLPSLPPDSTYQIWLMTSADPISVGLFVPDAAGRFTLATDTPPVAPRPVVGVSVTIEAAGGRDRPTGPTLLARAE
jgi:DNA repair exonuclease SbcCD ATPase subunit